MGAIIPPQPGNIGDLWSGTKGSGDIANGLGTYTSSYNDFKTKKKKKKKSIHTKFDDFVKQG